MIFQCQFRQLSRVFFILVLSIPILVPISKPVYAFENDGSEPNALRTGQYTFKMSNIPLVEVLERLSDSTGIKIVIDGTVNERVSFDLNDVSLTEALRHILRRKNFAILYDADGIPSTVYIVSGKPLVNVAQWQVPAKFSVDRSDKKKLKELNAECGGCMVEDELDAAEFTGAFASPALLEKGLESPDPDVQVTALRWAILHSRETGKEALINALMSNDLSISSEAIEILSENGADSKTEVEILRAVEEKDMASIQAEVYRLL